MWAPMELPKPTLLGAVLRRMPSVNRRLYDALLWGSAIWPMSPRNRVGVAD
jgi:hypothetical protein